jgi:hypothetical protein
VIISPFETKSIPAYKIVAPELKAPRFVVPRGRVAATHHVGFAVADGTGAGTAYFLQTEKLLHPIGPGERKFTPEGSHSRELKMILHAFLTV